MPNFASLSRRTAALLALTVIVPTGCRPKEEIAAWQERDPLVTWRRFLIDDGVDEPVILQVEAEIDREIEDATRHALDSAYAESEALVGAYAATPSIQAIHQTELLATAGVGGHL